MKEMAIAQDKKRSTSAKNEEVKKEEPQMAVAEEEPAKKNPSRMSFILPALQNHGFSDEDDDDEYSEDALKIKEDSFAASGLQSGSDSEKNQQQEAISAANSVTFSAAASSILAACGILINYLI